MRRSRQLLHHVKERIRAIPSPDAPNDDTPQSQTEQEADRKSLLSLQEQLDQANKDLRTANETIAKKQSELDAMRQTSSIKNQELTTLCERLHNSAHEFTKQEIQFEIDLQNTLADYEQDWNAD